MSAQKVPNELWLEVFANLSRDTLKDISLTYRAFCRISRPLIFTHFDFHPYCIASNDVLLLPEQEHVDAALERLNFWLSNEIAPYVRSCTITPWRPLGPILATWRWDKNPTPHVLLEAFFADLASFVGVQQIQAHGVYFTQTAIANLCRLPALTTLRIERFAAPENDTVDLPSATLGVSKFTVSGAMSDAGGLAHWIPLLRPDSLRELNAQCSFRLFGPHIETGTLPVFPLVHTFSMTLDFTAMSRRLAVLAKFPNVQTLTLVGVGHLSEAPQDTGLLPALREYTGPPESLVVFLARPTLTRLTIPFCPPDALMQRLSDAPRVLNITSLDVEFGGLDTEQLDALFARLPHLKDLRLHIVVEVADGADDNSFATTFLSALPTTRALPPSLEHLTVSWQFEIDDYENAPQADEPPELPELRDALVARCSALKSLWLDGHYFLFQWRDGGVESFAEDEDDAEEARKGFAAFWEAR
ncbi:hypothetical protein C8R46DRAFT_1140473 [Mycena filopes]|nr:hypothetical protein C8R46DRAFT_1140473 [Mycena filopes]